MPRLLFAAAALLLASCTALPPPTAETCATRPSIPLVRLTGSWGTGTLRFVLIGDAGERNAMSTAIFEAAGTLHPDAILLLGDNFYECGLDSPERWRDYEPLMKHGIPIYPVLGNHDHGCPYGAADPSPQVRVEGAWKFPSRNYAVDFGGLLELLFIDTTPIAEGWSDSDDVLCAARGSLSAAGVPSTALGTGSGATPKRWRFVAGHHPLYGSGGHALAFWSEPRRMRALRPILESGEVSGYLSGHDHHLELVEKNGVAYVLSGSASRLRTAFPMRRSRFRQARYGFAELEVSADSVRVRFHRLKGTECCEATEWFE